jgi:predicted transglutaminase-like cysteine proteinase
MTRTLRPRNAFRTGLIGLGFLAGLQTAGAHAADEIMDSGTGGFGRFSVRVAVSALAAPALPFAGNQPAPLQQGVNTRQLKITLPHSLRSAGQVAKVPAVTASPRSKPVRTASLSGNRLLNRPSQETGTRKTGNSFFGSSAIPFANIASAGSWDRVRHRKAQIVERTECGDTGCTGRFTKLASYIQSADNGAFFEKLERANRFVNENIAYREDLETYGQLDYWATTDEIVRNGAGDCEDFAILKYALLVEAGVPEKSMSLVVLKDLRRNLFHAVLAVSTNKGHFILDNVADRVYLDTEVPQYQPMFSFSVDRSWIHGTPKNSVPNRTMSLASIAPGLDRAAYSATPETGVPATWTEIYPVERN